MRQPGDVTKREGPGVNLMRVWLEDRGRIRLTMADPIGPGTSSLKEAIPDNKAPGLKKGGTLLSLKRLMATYSGQARPGHLP